jgi:hypothetical protein
MKLDINNVIIEITRKCNMECEHCLRGKSQNKEIYDYDIETFFSKVGYISCLTISGGEPSIAPHKINTIVDMAKKYKVGIGNFYIATNAKVVTNDFLLAVMRLYCYCDENEISALSYSNDYYHDEITKENIKKLEVFKFTSAKYERKRYGDNTINEGRAKENGIGGRDNKHELINSSYTLEDIIDDSQEVLEIRNIPIYLNCKGNLICGCDWSYKNQDKKKNIICHVNEMSGDMFINYVKQFVK